MELETPVTSMAPEQSAPTPNPAPAPEPSPAPQEEPSGPRLQIDERTGRRRVTGFERPSQKAESKPFPEVKTPEPAPEKAPEAPKAEPPEPAKAPEPPKEGTGALIGKLSGETPKPALYTPDELSLAIQLKNVDESRIPPQYKAQYDALKPKAQPVDVESQIRQKIQQMAEAEAMKRSGASKEDLEMGEFTDDPDVAKRVRDYRTAYEVAQQQIVRDSMARYEQQRQQQAAQMQVMQNVQNFITEQRKTEPHFDEIGKMMESEFENMPYKQAAAVEPAVKAAMAGSLTQEQADILGLYYDYCRKEFYAKLNGTSTTPTPKAPSVENRGTGIKTSQQRDYAQMLRDASVRDKSKVLAAWLQSAKKEK